MRTVVDASVTAKWYFPEPGGDAADRVLEDRIVGARELLAPDLIVPEFANVLWKRVRRRECSRAAATEILGLWEIDRPSLVPSCELAAQAFELAIRLEQPVDDCLYLALALEIEAPLVTADRQLARAARSVAASVELIL
jgi:predicted nucleic acid-binding protein